MLSSFICHNINEPFLGQNVTCDKKWILYSYRWWPALWLDWGKVPKHFPKPNIHQKKIIVTVWWSAGGLIHYSFLNPSETITSEKYTQQLEEMHWKLQHLQLALVNRKDPIFLHKTCCTLLNQHFKSWMNWAAKFCLICYIYLTSCQLTTTFSSILTTFFRENASTTTESRKCFPTVREIAKHGILCWRNKQT